MDQMIKYSGCCCSIALLLAIQLVVLKQSAAIPIDNGVVGLPQVSCEDEKVRLLFNTERPLMGRIFVKGLADDPNCMTTFKGNSATTAVFMMNNGNCNMRRQRRLGPQRGVEQSMIVVISFHDTFITKVDRAYRCTCFFLEADKVVTSQFDVSMLPTTDLVDTARMPLCTYSVRSGSINGPPVTYSRVGEMVFHRWSCESDVLLADMFGMLVHSCFVDDGAGQNRFQLLDQNGCAIDPVIINDLTYNQQANMAYVEAHVFKFADRVSTYFQCAISLCMKADGACVGLTPPTCNRIAATVVRRKRTSKEIKKFVIEAQKSERESDADLKLDVSTDRILVLDIDEPYPAALAGSELGERAAGYESSGAYKGICLSPHGMGILLAVFLLIVTASVTTVCVQCLRLRRQPTLKG